MAGTNFIIRGGADFSGINRAFQQTQSQMQGFQAGVSTSMSKIGKAFKIGLGLVSARAIIGFGKDVTKVASDLTEVQNVVDVTFGSMASSINEFSRTSIDSFGLSELASKKYASTMGAMMKSSGITGDAVVDMSLDLTKLTADMASFYNLQNDEAFTKIMSGMSGMSMPLKELGVNMNVANLEAFALSEGIGKAYSKMSQGEQTMLRYNYLMSVTSDAQGDFARNSYNWGHQLKILGEQWTTLKGTIGAGFINILAPIVSSFNSVIKHIQVAAEYFKAFTELVFGKTQAKPKGGAFGIGDGIEDMGDNSGKAADGLGNIGKAGKKAAKDLKGAISGFDEINKLSSNKKDGGSGIGGLGGVDVGGVGAVDLGSATSGEIDIDINPFEKKFERMKGILADFYENWGAKDLFKGIKDGIALIDFSGIKTNLKTAVSGFGEISKTALKALQPIYKSAGRTIGTSLKYGIAIAGNLFEPITDGFASFTKNMKNPIKSWLAETSETIASGYDNLSGVFENIGESWLESIEKYKPQIATNTEETLTNATRTLGLVGTVTADTFEIMTSKMKEFTEDNKLEIQLFTDSILGMFTDVWGFVNQVWEEALDMLTEAWDEWGEETLELIGDVVNDIGEWFLKLWNEGVKPVWDHMMEWLDKIWNETWKDIIKEIGKAIKLIAESIKFLWEKIFKPLIDLLVKVLVPAFELGFKLVLDVVGSTVEGIGKFIGGVMKVFNGLIDFVLGVFTGDWTRAWEGVSDIFGGIMDGLKALFTTPINWIISGLNTFIRGLNKIKIPDWMPKAMGGGENLDFAEIPMLAKGGITNGPMHAIVGDNPGGKEVIAPLSDLMSMINQAVNVNGGGSGGDTTIIVKLGEDTLTEKVISNINRQNRINGRTAITV